MLTLTSACTGEQAPTDFVDKDLSGRINGKDWLYKYAYIDPTIETPEEDDMVFIFLPYKPKSPCPKADGGGGDERSVMVSAPKAKKLVKLKRGTSRSLVFHFDRKGEQFATVAKAGKIKISDISDSTVKGKIFAQYNDGNWVSGNFAAVVCDRRDLISR